MRAKGLGNADPPVLTTPDDYCLFPIQVFCMSLAFITACRLATKYHPSGNGERCGVYTSFACRVDIVQNSCPRVLVGGSFTVRSTPIGYYNRLSVSQRGRAL